MSILEDIEDYSEYSCSENRLDMTSAGLTGARLYRFVEEDF